MALDVVTCAALLNATLLYPTPLPPRARAGVAVVDWRRSCSAARRCCSTCRRRGGGAQALSLSTGLLVIGLLGLVVPHHAASVRHRDAAAVHRHGRQPRAGHHRRRAQRPHAGRGAVAGDRGAGDLDGVLRVAAADVAVPRALAAHDARVRDAGRRQHAGDVGRPAVRRGVLVQPVRVDHDVAVRRAGRLRGVAPVAARPDDRRARGHHRAPVRAPAAHRAQGGGAARARRRLAAGAVPRRVPAAGGAPRAGLHADDALVRRRRRPAGAAGRRAAADAAPRSSTTATSPSRA